MHFPYNILKNRQDVTDVLCQSQAMCRDATKVEAAIRFDVLIKHLNFKSKDATRNVDEFLDFPEVKRKRKSPLG